MATETVNINGSTSAEAKKRKDILQNLENKLSTDHLEKLDRIANSATAKQYLSGAKYIMLKSFLKLG